MSEALARLEVDDLQASLRELRKLIADGADSATLRAKLDALHPADIAYLLEALPLEERMTVWNLVKADRDGEILVEVSEAVRESLIANMDSAELVAAAETLEADELADIAADLPPAGLEDGVVAASPGKRGRRGGGGFLPPGPCGARIGFEPGGGCGAGA